MKSVLIAIQPYWVFLIIAKTMGWEIDQEKTVEVRKTFPKDLNWNKKSIIYCSKNKQSFNRIPKKYQPLMERFLGRVIGEFVCEEITEIHYHDWSGDYGVPKDLFFANLFAESTCLNYEELDKYLQGKNGYGWHISDLVIYDKPKELFEFFKYDKYQVCKEKNCFSGDCWGCSNNAIVTRPPQSWCYVEELGAEAFKEWLQKECEG